MTGRHVSKIAVTCSSCFLVWLARLASTIQTGLRGRNKGTFIKINERKNPLEIKEPGLSQYKPTNPLSLPITTTPPQNVDTTWFKGKK